MKEIKENITKLFDQFFKEESGNRLSQFSLLSLKNLVLSELNKIPECNKTDSYGE